MQQGFVRSGIILLHDTALAGACFLLAFVLISGAPLGFAATRALSVAWLPVVVATAGLTFYLCGLHRRLWSYTSIRPRPSP